MMNVIFHRLRLDDLQCVFASVKGLTLAENFQQVAMMAVLDNEEVGSTTKQGAASDFLKETIFRICRESGMDEVERSRIMASSFMVSADNAQGGPSESYGKIRCGEIGRLGMKALLLNIMQIRGILPTAYHRQYLK